MGVTDILAGGGRLVRTQPKAIAIWGVVYLVLAGISMALIWPLMPALIEFQNAAMVAQAAQLPPPPPPTGFFGAIFGVNVIALVVLAAIFAAAVRAVARGGDDGFGFLRVGMDEARLIGLIVLLAVIGFVAMLAFGVVAGVVIAGLSMVMGQGALILILPLYLTVIALIVWAQVRISLAGALTVLRGRLVLVEGWRATRGRFWTLFGAYFLLGLIYLVAMLIMVALLNPGMLGMMTASPSDPAAIEAMAAEQMGALFGPRMIVLMLVSTVINAVCIAWAFGTIATAALAFDRADHGAA